jgi:hypothetical protein
MWLLKTVVVYARVSANESTQKENAKKKKNSYS